MSSSFFSVQPMATTCNKRIQFYKKMNFILLKQWPYVQPKDAQYKVVNNAAVKVAVFVSKWWPCTPPKQ